MKANKLAKQLKKELTRNPKKTAALAMVSIVALWFWGPLVWKWMAIAGDGTDSPQVAAAKPLAPGTPPPATPSAAEDAASAIEKKIRKFTWDKLLSRMTHDDRMQPATLAALPRDPFAMSAAEQTIVESLPPGDTNNTSSPRVTPAEPTPESLGLKLEGTLVTNQRRRATISGEDYLEGDLVTIDANTTTGATAAPGPTPGKQAGVEFLLELVEPRRVILSRHDKQYELMLTRATLSGHDKLNFGTLTEN